MAFGFTSSVRRVLVLTAALTLTLAGAAQAQFKEPWRGQITLYGWGAGIGGDFTPFTGGPTLSFDKS